MHTAQEDVTATSCTSKERLRLSTTSGAMVSCWTEVSFSLASFRASSTYNQNCACSQHGHLPVKELTEPDIGSSLGPGHNCVAVHSCYIKFDLFGYHPSIWRRMHGCEHMSATIYIEPLQCFSRLCRLMQSHDRVIDKADGLPRCSGQQFIAYRHLSGQCGW